MDEQWQESNQHHRFIRGNCSESSRFLASMDCDSIEREINLSGTEFETDLDICFCG